MNMPQTNDLAHVRFLTNEESLAAAEAARVLADFLDEPLVLRIELRGSGTQAVYIRSISPTGRPASGNRPIPKRLSPSGVCGSTRARLWIKSCLNLRPKMRLRRPKP